MRPTFFKGALIGGLGAGALLAATAALAGSGIGGIFNLGQTNTVDATSELNGTATNAMLDVANAGVGANSNGIVGRSASSLAPALAGINSGGGSGLKGSSTSGAGLYGQSTSGLGGRLITGGALPALKATNTGTGPAAAFEAGGTAAPFTVNSSTLVSGLNADRLDGIDSAGFYAAGSKVADSELLDGIDSSGFLRNLPGSVSASNLAGGAVTNAKVANDVVRHVAYNVAPSTSGNAGFWQFGPIQLYATCYPNFGLSIGSNDQSSTLPLSENMSWITTGNAGHGKRLVVPANSSAGPLLQTGSGGGAGTGNLVDWLGSQAIGGSFTYFADSTHCQFYGVLTEATSSQN